ncbi:4Fe-4S dicluster domain-containing protein, partial [Micromonospora sp. NPDC005172]|uniref:4Fe-4S dicluster domain-containing protein n=1 Tax=Micromonospora sp. NPDC005172 TaxID=3156867 RepID=UPI0033BF05EC
MPDPNSLYGPLDPAPEAGYENAPPRMGFFTDTSVCIGCKACEVACKEWNGVPESGLDLLGMSYDNTGALTANSWRHVAFIEQPRRAGHGPAPADVLGAPVDADRDRPPEPGAGPQFLGMPGAQPPGRGTGVGERTDFRWLMMSDVCKHCTHAACLDVCPTGSLFRT